VENRDGAVRFRLTHDGAVFVDDFADDGARDTSGALS
jgi:hypothetical protein